MGGTWQQMRVILNPDTHNPHILTLDYLVRSQAIYNRVFGA